MIRDVHTMVGQLAVSGPELDSKCGAVITAMRELGINGDITPNTTVLDGTLEYGCRILVTSAPVRENTRSLWERLRAHYSLRCAHATLSEYESGCVFDIFRPSSCPGTTPRPS